MEEGREGREERREKRGERERGWVSPIVYIWDQEDAHIRTYVSNQLYSTAQIRSSSRAHAQLGTRLPLTANMPKMLCTSRCSQSPKWLASLCMVISGPLKTEGYTREVRERVKMVGGCRHTQESQEKNHTTQLSATIRQPPPPPILQPHAHSITPMHPHSSHLIHVVPSIKVQCGSTVLVQVEERCPPVADLWVHKVHPR